MKWIPDIFRRHRISGDLSKEIRLHIEERSERFMRPGMSPKEAERQAPVSFGNTTPLEKRSREAWMWSLAENLWADTHFAVNRPPLTDAFSSLIWLSR
jgi:hypothetical protein